MVVLENRPDFLCVPFPDIEIIAKIFKHACASGHFYHKRCLLTPQIGQFFEEKENSGISVFSRPIHARNFRAA